MNIWNHKTFGLLLVGKSHITPYATRPKEIGKRYGRFTVECQCLARKGGEMFVEYELKLEDVK